MQPIRAVIFDLFGVLAVDGQANKLLLDFIASNLKPRYKIGVLSNAGMDWISRLLTPGQASLFDAAVISYQIGVAKPDARAYQAISEKLDVSPEECLFVDDIPRYCAAAENAGMSAVVYTTAEQAIDALQKILSQSEK